MYKPLTSVALALVVAGCGGTSLPQGSGPLSNAPAATGSGTLIYVSEGGTNTVAMLKDPSYKAAGKLGGLHDPAGLCANASGDIWVVNTKSAKVIEYAHGNHKSIASLSDPAATVPYGCSVDPTTGNLAVTTVNGAKGGGGGVLIYTGAKGTAKVYTSSSLAVAYFCAYDASGNLFVDGLDSNYSFLLMELPAGSTQLQTVTVKGSITFPGGIAWDGQHLAIGDDAYGGGRTAAIDQVSVSGTTASIVTTIPLDGTCDILQFAIVDGTKVAAPDGCLNELFVFAYPAGGKAVKTVKNMQFPTAVAVSPS
jgi:hypothetical protein